jgi:SPP1 family predicted phage head-tail adaptor
VNSFNDIVKLITIAPVKNNENGFGVPSGAEKIRKVFADLKSITRSEFHQSQLSGVKSSKVIVMWAHEYKNESIVEFGGKRYRVIRDYINPNNREIIELTVTDMGVSSNGGNNN